jgi:hypothetical protein
MIQFQSKPVAPKITPVMRSLKERMADDMNELAFAGDNVNVDTLRGRGYSDAAVKRLAPDAAVIARRRAIRQVAEA